MRARLNLLVLGVTSMVVVAFLIPLALLVRSQADQRARLAAERDAQAVASEVVRAVAAGEPNALALSSLPRGVAVRFGDGRSLGDIAVTEELVARATAERRAQSAYTTRGWELAIPVITRAEPIVVMAVVGAEELREGVARAWALLALLGLGMMAAALAVADRLGRTVVGPSRTLSEAALRLGRGELDTRVDEQGPPELRQVARAFNLLAGRLRHLLVAEREAVADLSHRLRTPLTAVRLEAEAVSDPERRDSLQSQIDRLQRAIDELIVEARRLPEAGPVSSDLAAVVRERFRFWEVLAVEEGRSTKMMVPESAVTVAASASEVAAVVDALIGNVFTHTPRGTGFWVRVQGGDGLASLTVSDDGPGFPAGSDPTRRGATTRSTGLGLDIARRLAERTGGHIRLGSGSKGGALVELRLGRGGG